MLINTIKGIIMSLNTEPDELQETETHFRADDTWFIKTAPFSSQNDQSVDISQQIQLQEFQSAITCMRTMVRLAFFVLIFIVAIYFGYQLAQSL